MFDAYFRFSFRCFSVAAILRTIFLVFSVFPAVVTAAARGSSCRLAFVVFSRFVSFDYLRRHWPDCLL